MPRILEVHYSPPRPEEYAEYLRRGITPPLDPTRLSTEIAIGDKRGKLNVPTNSDCSLVLGYKKDPGAIPRPAVVTSFAVEDTDLSIQQLQGTASKVGYRVSTGFKVPVFFADQIITIAQDPANRFERITMPPPADIEGADLIRSNDALSRYEKLAQVLRLRLSKLESKYVRDI